MWITLVNHNIEYTYPLLCKSFEYNVYHDKATGKDYYALKIDTLSQIFEIDSLCKSTNEYYTGFTFKDGKITLNDGGMYQ